MTARELLVQANLLEDMTFEAFKFLVVREYLSQQSPWSQHEVDLRLKKLDLRPAYDEGVLPLVFVRQDIAYWSTHDENPLL